MYSNTIQLYAPDYPVKSVTVFKTSRAEVVRTFEVDLKDGQNKLEIIGLPNTIDTDSVRVSGKRGAQELRLFDVFCTISPNPPTFHSSSSSKLDPLTGSLPEIPDSPDPEEALRILNVHLSSLQSEKRVREHESDLLVQYSKSLTAQYAPPTQSSEGGHPFSISAFLDEFVDRGHKNVVTLAEISERIVAVERKIAEQKERVEKRKGKRNARVDVVLGDQTFGQRDGQGLGKVEVKVTYIVSSTSWEPTYELHATTSPSTGKPIPKVTLHYRAFITQSTGEDWSNASLTLSTVSSTSRSASRFTFNAEKMPFLKGIQIRPGIAWKPAPRQGSGNGFPVQSVAAPTQSLFSSNAQSQGFAKYATQSTSLFGAPAGFGTFGSTQASQSAGGGLFGSSAGSGPSVFGVSASLDSRSTPAQALQSSGGGLFGSSGGSGPSAGGSFGAFGGNTSTQVADDEGFEQVDLPTNPGTVTDIPLPTVSSAGQDFSETETESGSGSQMHTTVVETPLAMTYAVDGKVTIQSDGVKHQVPIAVLVFGGDGQDEEEANKEDGVVIEYGVVPRIDARVFLQCRVTNTSEYRLFPGRVSVILDDGYIAKTYIGDINIGDRFTCTLGTDPTTQVKYTRTSKVTRSQAGSFAQAFSVVTYNTKVMLWNKHSFDLQDVRVYDCVPVYSNGEKNQNSNNNNNHDQSQRDNVSVILRKPAGLADAKEGQFIDVGDEKNVKIMWETPDADGSGGEKCGRLRWKLGVPAGKKETLELEWEVKAPADMALVESLMSGP